MMNPSALTRLFASADPTGAQVCLDVGFRRASEFRAGDPQRNAAFACDRSLGRFLLRSGAGVSAGAVRDAMRGYAPSFAIDVPGWPGEEVGITAAQREVAQRNAYAWGGSTDMPPILDTAPGATEPFSALARMPGAWGGSGAGGGGGMMAPMGVGRALGEAAMTQAPWPLAKWLYVAGAAVAIAWAVKQLAGGRRLRVL